MATKTEKRRSGLRERLIDIAEKTVIGGGLSALKARDLAKEAGCSVGAIYNVFGDLDDLALAVSARTFKRMGAEIGEAVGEAGDPVDALVALSVAYAKFAEANPNAWKALFEFEMKEGTNLPDWYITELTALFDLIAARVTVVFGGDEARVGLTTRTLFSAIHGMVLLSVEGRASGVPRDQLEEMIDFLIRGVSKKT